jgi:hypothetical protein
MDQDFENDQQRKLRITDPSGNEISIEPTKCSVCGALCVVANATCTGEVSMTSDMHLCEPHKRAKLGGDNRWYESVETDKDGPVQRELGNELNNGGGYFSDDEELGEDDNSEIRE